MPGERKYSLISRSNDQTRIKRRKTSRKLSSDRLMSSGPFDALWDTGKVGNISLLLAETIFAGNRIQCNCSRFLPRFLSAAGDGLARQKKKKEEEEEGPFLYGDVSFCPHQWSPSSSSFFVRNMTVPGIIYRREREKGGSLLLAGEAFVSRKQKKKTKKRGGDIAIRFI